MKTIMNICLTGPYSDGFTYQDNLLPKYQLRLGYRVVVVAPTWRWSKEDSLEHVAPARYVDKDGVEIVRIENDQGESVKYRFKTYRELKSLLLEYVPDIIFLHGLQLRDSAVVSRYVQKNPVTKLFIDNHADYSNSAKGWCSKYILHRLVWRHYAKQLEPLAEKFWGVLPARVDFLIENYKISRDKCGLLVMGADDDEVARASDPSVRLSVRERLGFNEDDFVVVTGGKIDAAKYQALLLMEAVHSMSENVKLLVFGPVAQELREQFEKRLDLEKMTYIPWANSSESYAYFAAADAICFPGRHSVYWEQAVAMRKPLIVKRWAGTEHIDVCNNVLFLNNDTVEEIAEKVSIVQNKLATDSEWLEDLGIAARRFMYSEIARKSIGVEAHSVTRQ